MKTIFESEFTTITVYDTGERNEVNEALYRIEVETCETYNKEGWIVKVDYFAYATGEFEVYKTVRNAFIYYDDVDLLPEVNDLIQQAKARKQTPRMF